MPAPDDHDHAATMTDYTAGVQRFLAAIDEVLAAGDAATQRYDRFCVRHGIAPGSGETALLAEHLQPGRRHIHAGLLALRRQLYDEHTTTAVARRDSTEIRPVAPLRSIGRRHRI